MYKEKMERILKDKGFKMLGSNSLENFVDLFKVSENINLNNKIIGEEEKKIGENIYYILESFFKDLDEEDTSYFLYYINSSYEKIDFYIQEHKIRVGWEEEEWWHCENLDFDNSLNLLYLVLNNLEKLKEIKDNKDIEIKEKRELNLILDKIKKQLN